MTNALFILCLIATSGCLLLVISVSLVTVTINIIDTGT